MFRHPPDEIRAFLQAVDLELEQDVAITLIGGAAFVVAFGGRLATRDIDVTAASPLFLAACARVNQRRAEKIPVQPVGIYSPPYYFEDRLRQVDLGTTKLRVFVPEVHDWVIMKLGRASEHDLVSIKEAHDHQPLSLPVLLERYTEAAPYVFGLPETFRTSLLTAVELLWGEQEGDRVDELTRPEKGSS